MSLADQITELLTPGAGKMMAESVVKNYCKKNKITPDRLTAAALPEIAQAAALGLKIFIGSDNARKMAEKILALKE